MRMNLHERPIRAEEDDELDRRIEQIIDTPTGGGVGARGRVPNVTANLEDVECDSYSEGDATEYAGGDRKREGLQPKEFLDWLATVEEVLEFKGIPDDKRVQLVATQLRGRATAW
ncbi:hypothetical protein CRG98_018715 [Punica granatum]|uniref:Retrotransposon gag domain-containing protein n=1 Tax=Punica granatum TaxID=22663 RepID=A0A2I0JYK6_PUNGR|nr:hypothetical protein CRG98_018715 [Punica granatum]